LKSAMRGADGFTAMHLRSPSQLTAKSSFVTARIAGSLFDTSRYSDHDLAKAARRRRLRH
jgi:hypothetical protein